MAKIDFGKLITESMMSLGQEKKEDEIVEEAASISAADNYDPKDKVIKPGDSDHAKTGDPAKSSTWFKETALMAGYSAKRNAGKTTGYDTSKVLK